MPRPSRAYRVLLDIKRPANKVFLLDRVNLGETR